MKKKQFVLGFIGIVLTIILYFTYSSYITMVKHQRQNDAYLTYLSSTAEVNNIDVAYIDQLWNKTVKQTLTAAGNHDIKADVEALRVPLYAAFSLDNKTYIKQFQNYITQVYAGKQYSAEDLSTKLSFTFFVSCFIDLCEQNHIDYPADIKKQASQELFEIYYRNIETENQQSFQTIGERIQYKLSDSISTAKHEKAISNEDLLAVAAGANLYHHMEKNEKLDNIIADIPLLLGKEAVVYMNDYWLYQPGIYYDHTDYQYSSSDSLAKRQSVNPDISGDIAQFSYMPLILQSFKNAADKDNGVLIDRLLADLSRHYLRDLVVYPDGEIRIFRTVNFMNGDNGYYGNKESFFYQPYALSNAAYSGAWAFLATQEIKSFYGKVHELFPLRNDELEMLSMGLDATAMNKTDEIKTALPDVLYNQYDELNCYLAAHLDFIK